MLAAAGAVLILSALLLLFHNRQEDRQAVERFQAVLEELRRVATDDATLPVGSLAATEGPEATQVPEMPTAQIDGYDYIGTLAIPALELELPVMAQWDYDRLTIAPAASSAPPRPTTSRCRSGLIDAKRSLSKAGHENPHNEAAGLRQEGFQGSFGSCRGCAGGSGCGGKN